MKINKKLIAVFMIAVLALSLAACGSGSGSSPVGTYKLTGMTQNGEATSTEDLEQLEALGLTMTIEIREDKTGTYNMLGQEIEFTWDDKNLVIEDEKVPYSFDGTILKLEDDVSSLEFTLITDEEVSE